MNFLKLIMLILLVLFMALTLVFFLTGDSHNMFFFGILSTWCLINIAHDNIMDKLK